ncbi:MAG: hypothetical protein ABW360_16240 [Phenylobacterium sp.]
MLESAWWTAWGAPDGGPVPEATLAAMRAQPRFHDAIAHALRSVLQLVDGDAEFHRTTQDLESLILATVALYLDATGDLTHRRLRQVAGVQGMLSGSRVSALLMRMQMIGFVRAEAGHAPGTAKVYRPTPRMISAYRGWLRAMLEAVEVMAPEPAVFSRRLDEPEAFRAFMAVLGKRILDGVEASRGVAVGADREAFFAIGAQRGGNLVLFALLDAAAAQAGHFPAAGPVSVSVSALARRGRVSRTQILKILRRADEAGLFVRGAGEGEGEVRPSLVEATELFYAGVFADVAIAAHDSLSDPPVTSR